MRTPLIRKNTEQLFQDLPEYHQRPVILNGTRTPDSESCDPTLPDFSLTDAVKRGFFSGFESHIAARYDYGLSGSVVTVHTRTSVVDMRIIDFSCFCF
ncbi:hypothetical protein KAH55_01880 [bacterium]|nr:hypothetical protein [bacterium]